MTDLELTKLCAQAIALPYKLDEDGEYCDSEGSYRTYWPLHDDAQAMALVKRFRLAIQSEAHGNLWGAHFPALSKDASGSFYPHQSFGPTPNSAICECVAKMQLAKNESKEA